MANFNPLSDTTGAKYIKIPRIDANGRDNTIRLQELKTIRIKFSDIGVVEFFIQSISEFRDYYLYRVSRSTAVNDTDDNQVLSYDLDARINSYTAGPGENQETSPQQDAFWSGLRVTGWTTVPVDTRSYFNQSTGVYNIGDYPNVSLTASFNGDAGQDLSEPASRVWAAILLNGFPIGGAEGPINQNSDFDFSRSFTLNQNDTLAFGLATAGGLSGGFIPVTQVTGSLTQSVDPVTATEDLIVLDPSFDVKFNGSNCDVLYGNVDGTAINTFYMDVDYAYQQTSPINFQQILSGSATKAEISNYNYEAKHLTLPRYEGSRATALRLNTYTQPTESVVNELGQTILNYAGDINTYGRTSTVDDTRAFIGYFDYIGGTAPELFDKTQAKLKYIVGENGRPRVPVLNDPSYFNVLGTFESQETAIIELRDPTAFEVNMSALQGKKPIFKPGVRVEPILYSQSGSSADGTNNDGTPVSVPFYSLTFNGNRNPSGVKEYYFQGGKTPSNGSVLIGLSPTTVAFNSNNTSPSPSDPGYTYSTSNYRYTVNSGDGNPKTKLSFTSLVLVQTDNITIGGLSSEPKHEGTFYLEILKNQRDVVAQQPITVYSDGEDLPVIVSTGFINVASGDTFEVQYYYNGDAALAINEVRGPSSPNGNFQPYFRVAQQIGTAASASYYTRANDPGSGIRGYWSTGSGNQTVLTSSAQLGGLYGVKFDGKDNAPFFSGFNAIRDEFTLQRGDEFRFEANEALVHQVVDVNLADGRIYATVFPEVSTETDIDSFLIRRYVPDATSVLLDTNKPDGATSDGFIKPEFLSSGLNENLDAITGQILDQNP